VFLDDALVRFVRAFDPVLKRVTFEGQELSDLIDTRSTPATEIVDQLAYFVFVSVHHPAHPWSAVFAQSTIYADLEQCLLGQHARMSYKVECRPPKNIVNTPKKLADTRR
jgi:hypothetical protein